MSSEVFEQFKPANIYAALVVVVLLSVCQGCSNKKNQRLTVEDKNTQNYQVSVEKRLNPRLQLKASTNYTRIVSSKTLRRDESTYSESFEGLRVAGQYWEAPNVIDVEGSMQATKFTVFGSPVNNGTLELNLGGSIQHMRGTLTLSGQGQTAEIDFVNKLGSSFDLEFMYHFLPNLSLKGAVNLGAYAGSSTSRMFDLGFIWSPFEHFALEIGATEHSYEHNVHRGQEYTSDYDLEYRNIEYFSSDPDESRSCINANWSDCPDGSSDSSLQIRNRGFKLGVLLQF